MTNYVEEAYLRMKLDEKKHSKKEDASNDQSDDGEGLDKVDPKAAAKKFKDRKDKDIDNDGDVDNSDKYMHKKRQAIGKAMKGDDKEELKEKEICPKCEGKGCDHCNDTGYHEAVEIDDEDGEVTKMKKDDDKKKKKDAEVKTDTTPVAESFVAQLKRKMQEATIDPKHGDQEKLEPKAAGEKQFKDNHKVDSFDFVPKDDQGITANVPTRQLRTGDNDQGDGKKPKTLKDIRK